MLPSAVALGLLLASCIEIKGTPSGPMKEVILGSYLVKSLERFYPDGVPADINEDYPVLSSVQLKAINSELEDVLSVIEKTHVKKYEILDALFVSDLANAPRSKLKVENLGRPTVKTSSDGVIFLDARVLQAIFRGALLENRRLGADRGLSGFLSPWLNSPQGFDATYVPSAQTEEQRAAIAELVQLVEDVRTTPGHGVIGDLFAVWGEDDFTEAPFFRMTDFARRSQDLQNLYLGASLFLLAHEYGHLALRHHDRLKSLKEEFPEEDRGDESVYCSERRSIEHEADLYGLVLLSPYSQIGSSPPFLDFLGIGQNLTGYRNFFQYGYDLGGFTHTSGEDCRYPTNKERYVLVEEVNRALTTARTEEFMKVLGQVLGK